MLERLKKPLGLKTTQPATCCGRFWGVAKVSGFI
jgi:hypothetical protein